MYLLLLGIIAVGAGLLLIYYSVKDKGGKKSVIDSFIKSKSKDDDEKGKVIYLFDDEDGDASADKQEGDDVAKTQSPNIKNEDNPDNVESIDPNNKDD